MPSDGGVIVMNIENVMISVAGCILQVTIIGMANAGILKCLICLASRHHAE